MNGTDLDRTRLLQALDLAQMAIGSREPTRESAASSVPKMAACLALARDTKRQRARPSDGAA